MTPMIDETHDPELTSWVESALGHADFPIQNLPLGIFSGDEGEPRPGVAIGDLILDLRGIAHLLPVVAVTAMGAASLNPLLAHPPDTRRFLRQRISEILSDRQYDASVRPHLHDAAGCRMHMPARIGDYTDFYAGIHHATNIGKLLRPDTPLLPNYKWVPIAYHGRASTIRLSGEPVVRPVGQQRGAETVQPVFGPSARLDYELELALWIGEGSRQGEPISIDKADRHLAGVSLLNDWSARDIQAWEYQPLGPFLSKNFHTTISPWIVTMEALAPFRVPQAERAAGDPKPLPYLWDAGDQETGALSIELEVTIRSRRMCDEGFDPARLSLSHARAMYWTAAQMIAHHTVSGCNLSPGDMLGTGTLSLDDPTGLGSMMEMTQGGNTPITLPTGEVRSFLLDGDEIAFSGRARADGFVPIGFGPCTAVVQPSRS